MASLAWVPVIGQAPGRVLGTQKEPAPTMPFKAPGNEGEKLLSHRLCVIRAEVGERQRSPGGGRSERTALLGTHVNRGGDS